MLRGEMQWKPSSTNRGLLQVCLKVLPFSESESIDFRRDFIQSDTSNGYFLYWWYVTWPRKKFQTTWSRCSILPHTFWKCVWLDIVPNVMAEVRALDAFVPSLKRMILLALLSSTLVEVGNGQCSDALGCSVGEVCCWGNYCVKGSSCAGQFCEYYTDCSSSTLICCNSVCVKRSSCLGQDCLGNDDCSKGEKCCKKKCVRGDHCPKSKCPFASCGFFIALGLPLSFFAIFCLCYAYRKDQRGTHHDRDAPSTNCCPVVNIWLLHFERRAPLSDNPEASEGSDPPPNHATKQGTSGGLYSPQTFYGAV